MELVIDKELLCEYFNSISPKKKDEKVQKLLLAIESDKNKIKISSGYLEILENYFKQISSNHYEFFKTFIMSLSDERRIISFKSDIKLLDEVNRLDEIISYEYNDYTLFLTKKQKKESKYQYNQSVYDNINKPNKDWFLLSLSTCYVVQLDYSDFKRNADLDYLITLCGKLSQKNKELHIVDSYFTLNNTTVLSNFKGSGLKVKCYTSSFLKSKAEIEIIRNQIKNYFGKNTGVHYSNNKTIIHERKIMIDSLVIDSTHDFSELTLKNNNWTLYFIICEDKKMNLIEKLKKYN